MLATNSYNPFENSLNNAKSVVGLDWLYESVKSQVGKLWLLVLAFFVGFPVILFLGFLLKRKRKKFQTSMKKELPVFNDYKSYLEFKSHLDKLESLTPSLKKVSGYNLKKAPWPLSYTLGQMQKMTSTLLTYNSWLKSRLNSLNEEQFKSNTTVFKFVSEKELWRNRNQAYQYWM